MEYRIEKDSLGEIKVPADKYWGANTQRSLQNFKIGPKASMPVEVIKAYGFIKKAAAITNCKLGILSSDKKDLIVKVCDEIITGELNEHFPLVIWQTGSGTHTNMNCNEVISNRAKTICSPHNLNEKIFIHPNDDVNKSQSTNDTFSSAMHISAYMKLSDYLLPRLKLLVNTLNKKANSFWDIIKVGRTHCMDATPIRLGQVFSGYASQIEFAEKSIKKALPNLAELSLGGTAVGTGLNTCEGYDKIVTSIIAELTGYPFTTGDNKFSMLSNHDAILNAHSALKQLAVCLIKISNDIRMLASGPRAGLNELQMPAHEAGSSIMPGKSNPTQIEALTMVCTQVLGNDLTITTANSQGQFELNTFKPVIIANFIQSTTLLGDAIQSFTDNCLSAIKPNTETINKYMENSLMLVTALTPHIGYEKAGEIANKALKENISLKEAAIRMGYVTSEQFHNWVNPIDMTAPNVKSPK